MKGPGKPPSKNAKAALFVLILAILACDVGGQEVSPSDERLRPPGANIAVNFNDFWEGLQLIEPGTLTPPWIDSPIPPPDNSTSALSITVTGFGQNQDDLNSDSPPLITLYRVLLPGCGEDFFNTGYAILGTVEVNEDRKWAIAGVQIPAGPVIIGATIQANGGHSGLGNLLVFSAEAFRPELGSPSALIGYEAGLQDFKGTAPAESCVEIFKEGSLYAPAPALLQANGDIVWSLSNIDLAEGANYFELGIRAGRGVGEVIGKASYSIMADTIQMEWPLAENPEATTNDYLPGCVTAWFGKNDFHTTIITIHDGLDLGVVCPQPSITPASNSIIYSVHEGTVFRVEFDSTCIGGIVGIDHGAWATLYWHLQKTGAGDYDPTAEPGSNTYVEEGIWYPAGTAIGVMGSPIPNTTCNGNRPDPQKHLHLIAFWWAGGSREEAFKNPTNLTALVPGEKININPQAGTVFAGENTREFKYCAAPADYWNINWSQVGLNNDYAGTYFINLKPWPCPDGIVCKCE